MAEATGPIVVIGSINMDLVCRTREIPRPGETVLGNDLATFPGGKGANQAVAAARLAREGTKVHLVGRVGSDDFGQRLLNSLNQHNVETKNITLTEGISTGVAMILVDRKGENSIVVAPGANSRLSPADIDAAGPLIRSASTVVMQLEIPHETITHAIALCQRHNVHTILDPAPAAAKLPRAMMGVDIFTPNQSEAEILLGVDRKTEKRVRRKGIIDPKQIAMDLLARGPGSVVLKLGAKGALLLARDGTIHTFKSHKIKPLDTTAAGDAFTGALAVAQAESMDPVAAVRFANAAGALCCRNFGAQPSLPSRDELEKFLASSTR